MLRKSLQLGMGNREMLIGFFLNCFTFTFFCTHKIRGALLFDCWR